MVMQTHQPLQLVHLELLHNYSTLTSLTLSGDPVLRNVWRLNAPREGFKHEFVLRSIFALSALHMAMFATDPETKQQHLQRAQTEHSIALRATAAALRHASAANCSAVFISATLTFLYAWACPRQPGDIFLVSSSSSPSGQAADWVFLLRGIRTIGEAWADELKTGPFGSMMRLGRESILSEDGKATLVASPAWQTTAEHGQFSYLRRTVMRAASPQDAPIYGKYIDTLERGFAYTYRSMGAINPQGQTTTTPSTPSTEGGASSAGSTVAGPALTSSVYYWLYCIEDDFLHLIVQRRPLALVVFAHFVVLLRVLSSCWWMQGWTTHLMQEIWELLDEDHRLWICWPIEELGWRPST
ncbi:hypothetical protein Sste5346_006108 [Sporothrix stenoceras]|uniref:C6 zinc finger domain containing protein n=1 Tax=Sporothrix stenoceras TaxID=5173 RepID=A0ABR3Z199_9PEZI